MRCISQKRLNAMMDAHKEWLDSDGKKGKPLALSGVTLDGRDLSNRDLRKAMFNGSVLSCCNFSNSYLIGADFFGACLHSVRFTGATMIRANLSHTTADHCRLDHADLEEARMLGACLVEATMCGANLTGVDMCGANISGANLFLAKLDRVSADELTSGYFMVPPAEGSYVAWKLAYIRSRELVLVKLRIPEDAMRCSGTTRECRASKADVLGIYDLTGKKLNEKCAHSKMNSWFTYEVGSTVQVNDFTADRWCTAEATGIYHYMSREEALAHVRFNPDAFADRL